MRFKILCFGCGNVVKVGGRVWAFRLRHSERNANGEYLGWNCDRCADAIWSILRLVNKRLVDDKTGRDENDNWPSFESEVGAREYLEENYVAAIIK